MRRFVFWLFHFAVWLRILFLEYIAWRFLCIWCTLLCRIFYVLAWWSLFSSLSFFLFCSVLLAVFVFLFLLGNLSTQVLSCPVLLFSASLWLSFILPVSSCITSLKVVVSLPSLSSLLFSNNSSKYSFSFF